MLENRQSEFNRRYLDVCLPIKTKSIVPTNSADSLQAILYRFNWPSCSSSDDSWEEIGCLRLGFDKFSRISAWNGSWTVKANGLSRDTTRIRKLFKDNLSNFHGQIILFIIRAKQQFTNYMKSKNWFFFILLRRSITRPVRAHVNCCMWNRSTLKNSIKHSEDIVSLH